MLSALTAILGIQVMLFALLIGTVVLDRQHGDEDAGSPPLDAAGAVRGSARRAG